MGAPTPLIVLTIPMLIAGVWLLRAGLWPPRVGAAPFCRECRYNLTGSAVQSAGARCPECGAATDSRRAVVFGARRRSWVKAWGGAILMPVGLTPHALVAYNAIPSWEKWFPTSMLIGYMDDSRLQVVDVSAAELQKRYQAGLSEENVRRLAATCLRIQSDPNLPGFGASSELLRRLYWGNDLTPSDCAQYYEQLLILRFLVRPRTPIDRPLLVQLASYQHVSYSLDFSEQLTMRICWPSPLLDGVPISGVRKCLDTGGFYPRLTHEAPVGSPGSYELTTQVQVDVFRPKNEAAAIYSFTREFEANVEVVPAGTAVIELVRDSALSLTMNGSIGLDGEVDVRAYRESGDIQIDFLARPLPVALAARVYVEADDRLTYVDELSIPALAAERSIPTYGAFEGILPAPPWTIVLRPDLDVAYEDPTIDAIWGEEIRIENVFPRNYAAPPLAPPSE